MLNWFWQTAKNESLLRSRAMATTASSTRELLRYMRVSVMQLGLTASLTRYKAQADI
jgi:hypothetical protein